MTITPLAGQVTGTHLLLELADTTQRQRISRENDLLARLDGSRLMVRQLAHEIKNPLGGLRGAAQLLERELPEAGAARNTRSVIIGEADRLAALVDSMAGPEPRAAEDAASTCTRSASTSITCCAPRRAPGDQHRARLRSEPAERACSTGTR